MHIIAVLIVGFLVGLVARILTPGDKPKGFIFTSLLGIVGAFVGSFLGQAIGLYAEGTPAGFVMAVVGAMIILYLHRKLSNNA